MKIFWILISFFLTAAGQSFAATCTVTNNNDSGAGSLRECITTAANGDIVDATGTLTGCPTNLTPPECRITLTSGAIPITTSITINGPGATNLGVNGNGASGVFSSSTGTVIINGITIMNGSAAAGGGILLNSGSLTLNSCIVSGSTVSGTGGGIAVDSGATLMLNNSTVSGNTASTGGGGIFNANGVTGGVTITNSFISTNTSSLGGGGIDNSLGTLTLMNSTVNGNTATTGNGGGILNNITCTLSLNNSTVRGNTATVGNGGGIFNGGGTLTITNSTISGNTATVGNGGGIDNDLPPELPIENRIFQGGIMTLTNSTISGNTADLLGGGIYNAATSTLTIDNSTISSNTTTALVLSGAGIYNAGTGSLTSTIVAGNDNGILAEDDIDASSGLTDTGYNLIGSDEGNNFIAGTPNTNNSYVGTALVPINPMLAALANYGGPTDTMALETGSVAIAHGSNPLALVYDQRGSPFLRTTGTPLHTDIGAFEQQISFVTLATPVGIIGTPISDTAILSAAATPTGTITFSLYLNDGSCTSTPVFTSTVPVTGNGSYNSGDYTPTALGTYYWIAAYTSANGLNPNVSTTCGEVGEVTDVGVPTLITSAYTPAVVGQPIFDTATLSGLAGITPEGTITFNLYSNPGCTTLVSAGAPLTVYGNGTYISPTFTPDAIGTYYWQVIYSGDPNNSGITTACGPVGPPLFGDPNESVVVSIATPSLITSAYSAAVAGQPIYDTATILGLVPPTAGATQGTLTFTAYSDTGCSVVAFGPVDVTVDGNGTYTSPIFTPTTAGTYYWTAQYTPDPLDFNNNGAGPTACGPVPPTGTGAPNESSVVGLATPSLTTSADPTGVIGSPIFDTATLTGLVQSTPPIALGTITFTIYPTLADCEGQTGGTVVSTPTVTGDGTYSSAGYTPTAAVTYYWTASYSGNANNNPILATAASCSAPSESTVVNLNTPSLITSAISTAVAGQPIYDTATILGLVPPTAGATQGTLTFTAYSDTGCSVVAFGPVDVTVDGNGTYTSPIFTPTTAGTYYWTAQYTPDPLDFNNNGAGPTACGPVPPTGTGAPNESSVVGLATPSLTTLASPTGVIGSPIFDTATLTGLVQSTPPIALGTITFTIYPTLADCEGQTGGTVVSTPTVTGDGTYSSAGYTPTAAVTYYWTASYSGNANNNPILATAASCSAPSESTVVSLNTPSLITSAYSAAVAGQPIYDTATILGLVPPTAGATQGTLTFTAYSNAACTTVAFGPVDVTVDGNGAYNSPNFIPTTAGTYYWTAQYIPDPLDFNNHGVGPTACGPVPPTGTGAPNESSVVGLATPSLTTSADPTGVIGSPIFDTATLTGLVQSTPPIALGTITFTIYPTLADCEGQTGGTVVSTPTVTGDGTYSSAGYTPTAAVTYYWTASYSGNANNNPILATAASCSAPSESTVVSLNTPSLITSAYSAAVAGQPIYDTATILGLVPPTAGATQGTLTFTAYSNAACTTVAFGPVDVTVDGNGAYNSPNFIPTTAGTYYWTAQYIPDPLDFNNHGVGPTACGPVPPTGTGAPNESSVVGLATPSLTTSADPTGVIGSPIFDTATLTGLVQSTPPIALGTITFTIYPTLADCEGQTGGTVVSTPTVTGDGTYSSAGYTPTAAVTYYWTASYSGNANNNPILATAASCSAPSESTVVSLNVPTLISSAYGIGVPTGAPAVVGQPIFDTASISGLVGSPPGGHIQFRLYHGACGAANLVYTSISFPVTGDGTYNSGNYIPTASGNYYWEVGYIGDGNNASVPLFCNTGTVDEESVVGAATPSLTTFADPTGFVGVPIFDTAMILGLVQSNPPIPLGTITFTIYPTLADCEGQTGGTPVYTATVTGDGTYSSVGGYTPTAAGTYYWTASYSGNANNNPIPATAASCNAPSESTVVSFNAPNLITSASNIVTGAPAVVGEQIFDTATLLGGFNPGGSIIFTAYSNANCTGLLYTSTVPVDGNGTYQSGDYIPTSPGTVYWTAAYVSNNTGINPSIPAACPVTSTNEMSVVSIATPTLVGSAPSIGYVGFPIFDAATLLDGDDPTGTITFQVFFGGGLYKNSLMMKDGDDGNPTCSGEPCFETTVIVDGNGTYLSGLFIPEEPGIYLWTATYSGDANNSPSATVCGALNQETRVVFEEQPEPRPPHRSEGSRRRGGGGGSWGGGVVMPLPPVPVPLPLPGAVPGVAVEAPVAAPINAPGEVLVNNPGNNPERAMPSAPIGNSPEASINESSEATEESGGCSLASTKNGQNPGVFFFALMLLTLWRARYFFSASKRS